MSIPRATRAGIGVACRLPGLRMRRCPASRRCESDAVSAGPVAARGLRLGYLVTCARTVLRALACVVLALPPGTPALARDAGPYDPGSLETVRGEVVRVERIPSASGRRSLRLVLRTDDGACVPVALGPARVAERQAFTLVAGERVDVTGWRVVRSKPPLAASEVRKDGATLRLRDAHGRPVWNGRRRAHPSAW